MKFLSRKKSPKSSLSKLSFLKDKKVLDRKNAKAIKGGSEKRSTKIWNGCGGITPQ